MDLGSIRKDLLELIHKLHLSPRNSALLRRRPANKGNLVMMLSAVLLIASLTFTLLAFGAINSSIVIGSRGTVNLPLGVGFYWDRNCTDPVLFLDWGALELGSTVNVTVFVRNEGRQAITLSVTAENWSPIEATNYIVFSSDYRGQTINPQENVQVTLSLTISPDLVGIANFNFDISVDITPV